LGCRVRACRVGVGGEKGEGTAGAWRGTLGADSQRGRKSGGFVPAGMASRCSRRRCPSTKRPVPGRGDACATYASPCLGLGVQGLGFRAEDVGCGGLEFRVWGLGLRV